MSPESGPDYSAGMWRYFGMFLTCVLVVGAMAVTMAWFFRRLNRIEEEQWGKKK